VSESQIKHYDSYGDHYVSSRRNNLCNRIYDDYLIEEMFRALPLQTGGSFLDPMCGGGELLEASFSRFRFAIGCDISRAMTRLASTGRKAILLQSDVTSLPFHDNLFDTVMIRGGLHHVHQKLQEALSEIHRVLRPGGYLVAMEPIDDLWAIRLTRRLMYRLSRKFDHTEERAFLSNELLAALKSSRLEVISYRRFGSVAYTLIGNTDVLGLFSGIRSELLIRRLIETDSWLSRKALLRRLSLACLFVAQKPLKT
jgi:ubiquinone/menaquinone biosynthesis C-methylase UbiE